MDKFQKLWDKRKIGHKFEAKIQGQMWSRERVQEKFFNKKKNWKMAQMWVQDVHSKSCLYT